MHKNKTGSRSRFEENTKKGGKYINKLLRLQPAKLKVENKRRKEKIYGFA